MKKKYNAPKMEVIKIKRQQILAGSPNATIYPNQTVEADEIE